MCELFGFSAVNPTDIRSYLKAFFGHSPQHPHGWGLMRSNADGREIFKEAVRAVDSDILPEIIDTTPDQNYTLAHIRLATVGSVRQENCHPYSGRDYCGNCWTLIHNGTIYSGRQLMKYLQTQKGDTDSERIFMALIDEINEKKPKTVYERFEVVDRLVVSLSKRNKLNLMIYDGFLLYVHQNMRDTLYYKELDGGVVFATVPLDEGGDGWSKFPMTQLCAYAGGVKVLEGTRHEHIFVPTLEFIASNDAMNI